MPQARLSEQGGRASSAPYPGKFAEAFEVLRRLHALPADGERHITHIEVAARICRDSMGGDELCWPFAFLGLANAGLQMPLQIVDADAMAHARSIVDTTHAIEFADKKVALIIETNAVRAVDVVPHGDKLAVGVKHLDAMRLPIGNVDIIVLVNDHIVRPDELTRIDAWRAPGEQVPPLGGEFMHAAVTIAVRDIQMPRDRRHRHVGRAIERITLPFGGRTVGTA